jgi:NADPH:quinone reductase-like Zn-dependent oxidoreductase
MRALQFASLGHPNDVLQLRSLPVPELRPGCVLVRVKARPINPSDMMFIRGLYGVRPHPPSGAGFEGMGVVEAVGEGVEQALVGRRVSFTATGTWQEYVVVPARILIILPDGISDETGSQIFVNPFTAWAMLHDATLREGDWLLQTAGSSAFGQLVIQLAALRGIRTISTVRRDDHIETLKSLGADEVINTEKEPLVRRVKELNDGKGVPKAFDAVAGKVGAEVLKCMSFGGTVYVYGSLSIEDIPVNAGLLIFKALTLKGFWLTDWLRTTDRKVQALVASTLLEHFSSGTLKVPVEAQYNLEDFKTAVEHAERPGRTGKVLLVG